MKTYPCPVCGYKKLQNPPADFNICPCCGTEFGYTDASRRHIDLTLQWIVSGKKWHSKRIPPPYNWNPDKQLLEAGLFLFTEKTETAPTIGKVYETEYIQPIIRYGDIHATNSWIYIATDKTNCVLQIA